MKKHRIYLTALCLALCIVLCACGKSAAPEIIDEAEETPPPAELTKAAQDCLGEWVSSGNTDDVMTLNEDGTCDVNGRTLYWTADTAERGFFRLEEENGSFVYFFRISRDPSGVSAMNLSGLIPAEEGSRFSRRSTGKDFMRRNVIEELNIGGGFEELDAAVLGEWNLTNADEGTENWPRSFTISEDGTVTVDGTTYTYVYQDYFRDVYEGGIPSNWDVVLYDDGGERAGGLYFQKYDYNRPDRDSVFLGVQLTLGEDYYYSYYQCDAVAINPDNFESFFDITEVITARTDAFGDVSSLSWNQVIVLKEEYKDRFLSAQLPLEYTRGNYIAKYVTYDTETGEYTIKDTDDEPNGIRVSDESYTETTSLWSLYQGCNLTGNPVHLDESEDEDSTVLSGYVSAPSKFSVDRVEGTLYLGDPLPGE